MSLAGIVPADTRTANTPTLRATAKGRIVLKRLDYGVGQSEWASTGQIANEVTVDLNITASRPR